MTRTIENSAPFVLEGAVSELHTEIGRENLLRKVLTHYKGQSALTGVAAAAGDLFGQAANAAMLAMYDGEYTESFVCLIDGQVVCGTFGGASKLREGDRIKAVVSRQGDVLVAHAMLSEDQGYLWIKHPYGLSAERAANFKLAGAGAIFTIIVAIIFDLISGRAIGSDGFMDFTLMMLVAAPVLCFGLALWANSDMKALAGPSTEMFRLLRFANPEKVNLNKYKYGLVHYEELIGSTEMKHQYENVHCYKKAIEDGKIKMAV